MLKCLMAGASAFAVIMSASAAMADDVGLSAAERAANIKAHNARKAQGQATDTPRGGRGAGQQPQRAQQQQGQQQRGQQAQQQAMQRARRCQDAVADAQNTAVGASVLSGVAGFLPFGGTASGIAGAAVGVGATAAGEVARQKMASAAEGC